MDVLEVKNLHVEVEGKKILKGINLMIRSGELHALMGPNGSGKSTLARVLMGDPRYIIIKGDIILNGKSIIDLSPDERSKLGLFLQFQYPVEIEGVSMFKFLWNAYKKLSSFKDDTQKISALEFKKFLEKLLKDLDLDTSLVNREVNVGFSGGERKRTEILQLLVLNPKFIILDEPDTGLDVDALKLVGETLNSFRSNDKAILAITHYQRILHYIKPDYIHILLDGAIVKEGDYALALLIEEKGYDWLARMR